MACSHLKPLFISLFFNKHKKILWIINSRELLCGYTSLIEWRSEALPAQEISLDFYNKLTKYFYNGYFFMFK